MKKLILFILIPFFIACGDDDSNNNSADSFLDEYNGVIWLEEGNEEVYDFWWIFTPNGVTNGERYGTDCDPHYEEWGVSNSLDVIENSSNRLVIGNIEIDDNETSVPVTIAIDEIKVKEDENHTKQIKVDDDLMMEMKYPSLDQFIKSNFDFKEENNMERSFDLIASCIDKIYNEEEVWSTADCTKKEVVNFLEQMNSAQFKEIESFFETMPKLSHTVDIVNPKTKKKSTVVLEGLSSFFA